MTCIVGLVHHGKVYLGADSAGVCGEEMVSRKDPKVFRVGDFVLGYTTSFRMGQALRYGFAPPPRPEGMATHEYLCTLVIDALRATFQRAGCATLNAGVETCGTFLLGYRGEMFLVGPDYQVGQSHDRYDACGGGGPFALGSLSTTEEMDLPPRRRLELALAASAKHCASVRGPFLFEEA